jgi:hypothetical protein
MRLNVVLLLLVLTGHIAHADAQDIATWDALSSGLAETVRLEQHYGWALEAQPLAGSSRSQRKGRMSRKKAVLIGAAIGGGIGAV